MDNKTQLTIASSIIADGLIVSAFLFAQGGGSSTKKFKIVMENNKYNLLRRRSNTNKAW